MMKKRLTRLFAVCLGLIIVLSACASVDVPSNNSTTTEESKATSALELSEVNAEGTSSETELSDEESSESEPSTPDEHLSADAEASLSGGITITPIEPTYPEERETTLELVKEYSLGEGGIPFYLQYDSEPANGDIVTPYCFLVDENGNVYSFDGAFFYDLQNHTELELPISERTVGSVLVHDGKLYCMNVGGVLNIYTMQEGKIDTVKFPTIKEGKEYGLFISPDGVPTAAANGNFYGIDGERIADVYNLSAEAGTAERLTHFGREYTYEGDLSVWSYVSGILTARESQEYEIQHHLEEAPYWRVEYFREDIFYQYDVNGDPLSEFLVYLYYTGQKIPCSVIYEGMECKSYFPLTVIVGKQRFDNLIDANWFVGADGTIYLMVIDPDGGKLYKINPGYSDVTFTDFETDMQTEIQQTAAATSTTVKHANVSADAAEMRADEMSKLSWTVQPENRYVRTGAALPHHLAKNDYDLTQTGIPYCWGGYNGLDTVDSYSSGQEYKGTSFTDIITREAADGRLYMTGNINSTIVANTVGLDCSGYACSVYGLISRTNTEGFIIYDYGHEVTENDLKSMDLLVLAGTHCYLFDTKVENDSGLIQYWVYDCTRSGNIDRTSRRLINKPSGYTRLCLCYTYTSTTTHHTYSCSICGISETEAHTWSYARKTASVHTRTCTVCGREDELEHTWSYEQNSATTHIRTCTVCGYRAAARHSNYKTGISATEHVVICGYCQYSVPENHTFTYPSYTTSSHTKRCSGCGYNTTETHTNVSGYNTTHHWYGCTYCDYTLNKAEHWIDSGSCLYCPYYEGAPLNGADLPEEPSTEPPVSDEPFVVLCVPHEDELFERIRR